MTAPLPDTEDTRLAALRQCRMLDTAPDADFDDITRLAAQICEVPIAAVSLIDSKRQWFKSILGLDTREISSDAAFCAHTILQPQFLEVSDARTDARFADNPLVTGSPNIRFYAGAPLVTSDGHALGSLCVIDRVPRQLTADQQAALRLLARQVVSQLEMARRFAEQERLIAERATAEVKFRSIIDVFPIPYALNDENQNITFLNVEFIRTFGYTLEDIPTLADWWPKAYPDPTYRQWVAAAWQARLEKTRNTGEAFEALELNIRCKDGRERTVLASAAALEGTHLVILYDITAQKQAEQALRESKQFIESISDHSTSIIFVFDLDTMANVYSNRNVGEFLGYSTRQVQEMGDALLPIMLHPDDLTRIQAHFAEFAGKVDGEVVEIEYRARHADGGWRWIWNREVVFKRHSDGTPCQIMGTAQDITERKQAQEETARLAAIVESSRDAILGMTLDGTLVNWNAAAEQLYGYTEAEVIGQHASVLASPAERGFIGETIRAVLKGEKRENIEAKRRRKDGGEIDVSLTFSPIKSLAGEIIGIGAIARDITAQKQAEQTLKDFSVVLEFQKEQLERANAELAALATLDGLTSLRNRRAFDERLGEEFERASRYHKPLSLLMLDIDFFKQYNDTFGHQAGDEVLRMVGRTLQKATRDTDFTARYGGEEFAVILPETDGDGAMQVAERIRAAVATKSWENREITASLGVCTLRLGMEQAGELVSCADLALYQSKAEGRNRVTRGCGAAGVSP